MAVAFWVQSLEGGLEEKVAFGGLEQTLGICLYEHFRNWKWKASVRQVPLTVHLLADT